MSDAQEASRDEIWDTKASRAQKCDAAICAWRARGLPARGVPASAHADRTDTATSMARDEPSTYASLGAAEGRLTSVVACRVLDPRTRGRALAAAVIVLVGAIVMLLIGATCEVDVSVVPVGRRTPVCARGSAGGWTALLVIGALLGVSATVAVCRLR
jgi:hypothetical protein